MDVEQRALVGWRGAGARLKYAVLGQLLDEQPDLPVRPWVWAGLAAGGYGVGAGLASRAAPYAGAARGQQQRC
ncbi:hypothetical protein ACFVYG_32600 [Streptomyces sp. NPDC058256]|uniref:hypothetical protein n=1 Tax=Streptomyces sp. NPDC058256 TaxID=3346408 RepID=UPI0036E5321E